MTQTRTRWRRQLPILLLGALLAAFLAPSSTAHAETLILVQAGDSLSSIAFDHGVTVDALMVANGLTDPDLVYMGQELVIPVDGGVPTTTAPPLVVTVEYGESLSIIAARHGVTVSAIMEENDLTDPDRIYVGQVLTIPNPVVPTTTAPPTTTLPSLVVTVEYGDSLSVIAGRYGVSVQAIVEANGITNPDRLSVGQSLVIPGVAPPVDPEAPSTDYGPVIVDGRGWGHGRGMGQYGALGYAIDEGWTRDQILDHYYGGTVAGNVGVQEIGVRLLAHDGGATSVYVEDALLGLIGDGSDWMQVSDHAVRVDLLGSDDRWEVSVAPSCAGPFTGTGVVLEGSVIRILPAHMAVPSPPTTTVPPLSLRPRLEKLASAPRSSPAPTITTQGAFLKLPVTVLSPGPELPAEKTTITPRSASAFVATLVGSLGSKEAILEGEPWILATAANNPL